MSDSTNPLIELKNIELKSNLDLSDHNSDEKSDFYYLQFCVLIDLHFLQNCRFTDLAKLSDFYPLTNYGLKTDSVLFCFKKNETKNGAPKYKIIKIKECKNNVKFNKSNYKLSTHLDLLNITKNKLFILSNAQLNFNIYHSLSSEKYRESFIEYIKNTYENYEIVSTDVNILKELKNTEETEKAAEIKGTEKSTEKVDEIKATDIKETEKADEIKDTENIEIKVEISKQDS